MKKNEIAVKKDQPLEIDKKETAWNLLSPQTQSAYKSDYDLFFKFVNKPPEQVTPDDLAGYIKHMEAQGFKGNTINRRVASLSKLFRVLASVGEIEQNPVAVLKEFHNIQRRTSREFKISITLKDVQKAFKRGYQKKHHTDRTARIMLIIEAFVATGLRVSSLIGIKNSDINDNYNKDKILITTRGKGKVEDFVYLDKELYERIKEVFPDRDDRDTLFYSKKGSYYSRKYIYAEIVDFFKRMIDKHVHPHMLRHLYATHKINVEGRPIKEVSLSLHHRNISTTMRYVDTKLAPENANIKI